MNWIEQHTDEAQKLYFQIAEGIVYMCPECKRKNKEQCTNRQCMEECEKMTQKKDTEQISLFEV